MIWTKESDLVPWLSDLPSPRSLRGTGGTGVWNPDKAGQQQLRDRPSKGGGRRGAGAHLAGFPSADSAS